jgi:hypothetical protein
MIKFSATAIRSGGYGVGAGEGDKMNITEASKIMKTVALSKSKLDKKNERIKQLESELAEYEGYWKALPYGAENRALTFDQFASEQARKDSK